MIQRSPEENWLIFGPFELLFFCSPVAGKAIERSVLDQGGVFLTPRIPVFGFLDKRLTDRLAITVQLDLFMSHQSHFFQPCPPDEDDSPHPWLG